MLHGLGRGNCLLGSLGKGGGSGHVGIGQDSPAFLFVRAHQAHDHRHSGGNFVEGDDDSASHLIATSDATEDVDQHPFDVFV